MRASAPLGVAVSLFLTACASAPGSATPAADLTAIADTPAALDVFTPSDLAPDTAEVVEIITPADATPALDSADAVADLAPPDVNADASPPPADVATLDLSPIDAAEVSEVLDAPDVPAVDSGPPPPTCAATVSITGPSTDAFFALGGPITLTAMVTSVAVAGLSVAWTVQDGPALGVSVVKVDGTTSLDTNAIPAGKRVLVAQVVDANGACTGGAATSTVTVCKHEVKADFNAALDPLLWVTTQDAAWDPGGWIEMTYPQKSRQGAIYNALDYVQSGDVSIHFQIATGGGSDPGADGMAMTILEASKLSELTALLAVATGGGGLGYGVGGKYGAFTGHAFTVEIDTWYNQFNGNSEFHTDPTSDDHVEVTLDGDPGKSVGFISVPELEDLAWRSVDITIHATHLTVRIDGKVTIDGDFPQLEFRGGYIFFSGSTGYYTNYHRFDDLHILHGCVP